MFWIGYLIVRYTLGSLFLLLFTAMSSRIRERKAFEKKWGPIHLEKKIFSTWIHVSSEGELEQVMPFIEKLGQNKGELILLLFTSPSLEKKMQVFNQKFPHVEVAAFPLLNFSPFSKNGILTLPRPKLFFMVRYDFFPELLLKAQISLKSVILSASLKGKDKSFKRNSFKKYYYKRILHSFNIIFAAGPKDERRIRKLLGQEIGEDKESNEVQELNFLLEGKDNSNCSFPLVLGHDFRHGQILKRQREKKSINDLHCIKEITERFDAYELPQRIVIGSMWSSEKEIFTEELIWALKAKSLLLLIAPHKLSGPDFEEINELVAKLKNEGVEVTLWNEYGLQGEGNLILCSLPGLLCELYPYFGHSYVGGGHGRSIHSVLEPFWGGCHVFCGPKTHRSTEFDYMDEHSPLHLHVVNELNGFYPSYTKNKDIPLDRFMRQKLAENVLNTQERFLDAFSQYVGSTGRK